MPSSRVRPADGRRQKKVYQRPELTKFGSLVDLTAGGSGGEPEGFMGPNMGQKRIRP